MDKSEPKATCDSKDMLSTAQKSPARGRILTAGQGNNWELQTSDSHQRVSIFQPLPFAAGLPGASPAGPAMSRLHHAQALPVAKQDKLKLVNESLQLHK